MLLASSVSTPIDSNSSHLLALRVRVLCELGLEAILTVKILIGRSGYLTKIPNTKITVQCPV